MLTYLPGVEGNSRRIQTQCLRNLWWHYLLFEIGFSSLSSNYLDILSLLYIECTISSALMLVLKNANFFQSNDIPGKNFSIADFMFMCNLECREHRWTQKTVLSLKMRRAGIQKHTCAYISVLNHHQLLQFTGCVMSHNNASGISNKHLEMVISSHF